MSRLLNGNNLYTQSFRFPVSETTQFGEARRFAQNLAEHLDFSEVQQGRVSIIINELGNNLMKYARNGELMLRAVQTPHSKAIEIISIDSGPGMNNVDLNMTDGFTTGSTPGTGLGAVRRQSNFFDHYSLQEKGTVLLSVVTHNAQPYEGLIGAICRAYPGEDVSGDSWSLLDLNGKKRILVADGLGHGQLAHKASLQAIEVFQSLSSAPIDQLLTSLHTSLKSTRGAAVFLLELEGRDARFCGVGNIRCVALTDAKSKTLISQNGTAGVQIRAPRVLNETLPSDPILILHSDGISAKFDLSQYPGLSRRHPAVIASVVYRDFARSSDDSTILALRGVL